ncbi:SAM-dependent MidA family methyltransferase [Paenibacillus phyllosphaerae]|uniref:SAM-dependent MidA family methyltransferase n=2 Tax=Paenibacillus phyllosphaerae TaxID=274593 RepID=A0A7W5AUK0_9BACL|nr:SAM-dependent MidA family methyltransferase [Paenibacillus phyllosphaerae]
MMTILNYYMRISNLLYLAASLQCLRREGNQLAASIYERIGERIASSKIEGTVWQEGAGILLSCITFRDYMEICLYDPNYGYYRSGSVRVGKSGDFYTSSAIGSVMGEKVALCMREWIDRFDGGADAAEWAAGTGRLSEQILSSWEGSSWPGLRDMAYAIVDNHPEHLATARQSIETSRFTPFITLLSEEEASQESWRRHKAIVMVANELLDAFPVHLIERNQGELWEIGVALRADEQHQLQEVRIPLRNAEIIHYLQTNKMKLREGQRIEVNLDAASWLHRISNLIEAGALILIDYGHETDELLGAHRHCGTLMCYSGHVAHDNPYIRPGKQDITAHVNFSAIRSCAESAGFVQAYYATQKQFLIDYGVLSDLHNHGSTDPFSERARRNRSIRQLLLSDGMSETFKVLILTKGASPVLTQ